MSEAFYNYLRAGRGRLFSPFLKVDEEPPDPEALAGLVIQLEAAEQLSFRDGLRDEPAIGPEALQVLEALLGASDPESEIFADEWIFVLTRSWIGARTRTA